MIKIKIPNKVSTLPLLGLLLFCQPKSEVRQAAARPDQQAVLPKGSTAHLGGRELALRYCQGCHLFPEPALLDKQSWQRGVLPNMALRLGLGGFWDDPYAGMEKEEILAAQQAGIFAQKPQLAAEDWEKIVAYYLQAAPNKPLPPPLKPPVRLGLPLFQEVPVSATLGPTPLVTLVQIDTLRHRLLVGDQHNHLYVLNPGGQVTHRLKLPSPPTAVLPGSDGRLRVLTVGVLTPSDRRLGTLTAFQQKPGTATFLPQPILGKLLRPVQVAEADLDQDSLADLIVAEHGHHTGQLRWYKHLGKERYAARTLSSGAGFLQVIIRDFNADKKVDVLALRGQGQEGIFLFLNQGQGRFEEKTLLRFPPVYGSSYLEVADFNHDGFPDLVYANGDNADFSGSLKAYHGLRIYLNDGKNNFRQAFFYPLHGATKVIARDYDQDGDLDLAAIAFYPDYARQPQESFVYLENKGHLQFQAATFANSGLGHWLTITAGDLDQDGDVDLVLGASVQTPAYVPPAIRANWLAGGLSVLVLRNELSRRQTNPLSSFSNPRQALKGK